MLMSVSKGKKYLDISLWSSDGQSDKFLWTRLFESTSIGKKSAFFRFFAFIFNNKEKKKSQKMESSLHFYEKNSPHF